MPVKEVRFRWNPTQSLFMQAKQRYIDFEGAIRSGKTTPAIWKGIDYAIKNPGARMLMTRWTQEALDAQLKATFYEHCPQELLKSWNAKEKYQELTNGARIYFRALRPSDDKQRYSKLAGLTLSWIWVDQAEELPDDFWAYLVGRLSQPGYPQQLILTPNPPAHDHWLSKEFPDGSDPTQKISDDHLYICTSVYDNKHILGADYIKALEHQFPVGTAEHRRMIEGRRGLSIIGDPVYKGYFSRDLHSREILPLVNVPLIRGWDFGHKHPAVIWCQFTPWGGFRIYQEFMGTSQFLEDFAPQALTITQSYFPEVTDVWDCCDPAGAEKQGHGLRRTAVDVLADLGVYPRFLTGSNDPARRDYAIQHLGRFMSRITRGQPSFEVHPRCRITTDGLEAGYVWEEINRTGTLLPNTRRPKKDGYYDHLQNCIEYVILNFAGAGAADWRSKSRSGRPERDHDPYDDMANASQHVPSRAGY